MQRLRGLFEYFGLTTKSEDLPPVQNGQLSGENTREELLDGQNGVDVEVLSLEENADDEELPDGNLDNPLARDEKFVFAIYDEEIPRFDSVILLEENAENYEEEEVFEGEVSIDDDFVQIDDAVRQEDLGFGFSISYSDDELSNQEAQ
ncbi:unnamed protein product, partial [Mesorhabditis belari]|uniref:Uncharacterized protein n=1 Tax=Mesorhabditis belari TaxID=2138241 RepID=A0AAF3F932_9BILA